MEFLYFILFTQISVDLNIEIFVVITLMSALRLRGIESKNKSVGGYVEDISFNVYKLLRANRLDQLLATLIDRVFLQHIYLLQGPEACLAEIQLAWLR